MMQTHQKLNNLLFILNIIALLFFVQSTLIASKIVDDIYLYDVSMFQKEGINILPCPEIIIRFNELGEDFKPGDKIYIKLKPTTKKTQPLLWYYPSAHEKNVSFLNRLLRKTKNIKSVLAGINFRVKKFKVFRKTIPYPTVRFMSDDILGNARGKVASKLQFNKTRNTIQINIENKMSGVDILRIKGLFLSSKNGEEAGPSILLYDKNKNKKWKRLGNQKFIIGKSLINDLNPKRFIRKLDNRYFFSLNIEIGQNPTIKKNEKLIIKLSDDFQASWSDIDKQILIVKEGRKEIQYKVTPEFSDRNIVFPINFNIPKKSQLILPKLEIKSSMGEIDPLSKGFISIHSELTGNFDHKALKKETILGGVSDSLLFIYPRIKIRESDLMFYLSSEKDPEVSIEIYTEEGSYFEKGDIIKIKIPHGVNVDWGKIPRQKQKGIRVRRTGNKLIEVKITQTINQNILLDKITFNKPAHSIPPFELVSSFSFAPDTLSLSVEGPISFGQPKIRMKQPKLFNRLSDEASLNDIIITEDDRVTTLKGGGFIEIIGDKEFFSFNSTRWADIDISGSGGNLKISINYSKSTMEKIVFNIIDNFEKGERAYISNIPIANIKKTGNLFLKYNINNKSSFTDQNGIKIIDLKLDLSDNLEFVKDLNMPNKLYWINGLNISMNGVGKLLNQGERLILSLPEEMADWGRLDKVSLSSSDVFRLIKQDNRHLVLMAKQDIYNAVNLLLNNIPILPTANEFINQKLKLVAEVDTSVFDMSNHSITYSFLSFESIVEQTFFTDDTSWHLYKINMNTNNLDKMIIPGEKLSIILPNEDVKWDTRYNSIEIIGDHADKINDTITFNGQKCFLTVRDSVKAKMSFEISGLRIQPITTPDINFQLRLSINDDGSIAAIDPVKKLVKSKIDYSLKQKRSIEESSYGIKSHRNWKLIIPDTLDYKWDIGKDMIAAIPDPQRPGMIEGHFNFDSFSPKVKFINEKTVEISINNGYESPLSQRFQLSGSTVKHVVFNGLMIESIINYNFDSSFDYLDLIVETPYGIRTVHSHLSGEPDWGLKINGNKSFSMSELVGQELEIKVSMPQVQIFGTTEPMDEKYLDLYTKENQYLFDPLVKNIWKQEKSDIQAAVEATLDYIKMLYSGTGAATQKGDDWKTWYYLSYAKWHANKHDFTDELNNWLESKNEPALVRDNNYIKEMEKAKIKGYQPKGSHQHYPPIKQGDLLAEIDDRINDAKMKYEEGNVISAEIDFLDILTDIEKNDGIKHRSAIVDYWLGRIALSLDDIEYDDYEYSYPFKKFYSALENFKRNKSHFVRNGWIEDSTKKYINISKKKISERQEMGSTLLEGEDIREGKKSPISLTNGNTIRFSYKDDNYYYTYKIEGKSGAPIGIVNKDNPEKNLIEVIKLSPTFDDELRLGRGGDYSITFSAQKQSLYNIITTAILLGLLGVFYG
ncbi:MAG: hypothetical protein H8E71_06800 [Candidatus Marinimicrobia bacterium]|nr:hypothetical protein [Candidatus Neomarinimicrobiota bacterium]MBL7109339.1 hypothetical protein [Candidatus Neomarinimicrobiota bacterium]